MATPTLVYDDDCGFCTWCAERVVARSDLRLVGFSEISPELEERLPEDFRQCSHLVTDVEVYSCGASIEEAVLHTQEGRWLLPIVERLRRRNSYVRLREAVYRWVADHRDLLGRIVSSPPPAREQR